MAFATCDEVRIHYEVAGEGPPLLLYHGFGGSCAGWLDFGGVDTLRQHYRLIMIDARGHGRSDKPHGVEAYSLSDKVADVLAVLDDLAIERAHFYGYSYGGLMGWALGMNAPERFASMVIGGAHPMEPHGPELFGRFDAMLHYLGLGMDAYVRWREEHGVCWPWSFRARMLANDPVALSAFLRASLDHYPLGNPSRMTMPVLVVSGDDDELMAGSTAKAAAARLPCGHYVEISRADHPALYLDGARVMPLVEEFLARQTGAAVTPQR